MENAVVNIATNIKLMLVRAFCTGGVAAITLIHGLDKSVNGLLAADCRILIRYARFEEIVGISHAGRSQTDLKANRGGRSLAYEHCDSAGAASGTRWAGLVHGYIGGDYNGVAAVPGGGFAPGNCVEEGSGGAVTGVGVVKAFYFTVAAAGE